MERDIVEAGPSTIVSIKTPDWDKIEKRTIHRLACAHQYLTGVFRCKTGNGRSQLGAAPFGA